MMPLEVVDTPGKPVQMVKPGHNQSTKLSMADEQRLGRIEEKVDKIGEILVTMARLESRSVAASERMEELRQLMDGAGTRVAALEARIATLERNEVANQLVLYWWNRIVLAGLAVASTVAAAAIIGVWSSR